MQNVIFIVNPISGRGKKKQAVAAIKAFYRGDDYRIVFTEYPGHAIEIARTTECKMIFAVGGDGTLSEVARGILLSGDPEKTLATIPCGSGDGLALQLGVSRIHSLAALQLSDPKYIMMDYATVRDVENDGPEVPFFVTAGVGFDAEVADSFAKSGRRGLSSYVDNVIREWHRYEPDTYKVTVDGVTVEGKAELITVGNAGQWGNNAWIAAGASVMDGLLNVSFVSPFGNLRVPAMATALMIRHIERPREVKTLIGKHIIIERTYPGPAHYDGEPCFMGRKIEIEVHPAALRVAIPKHAISRP